MKKVWEQTASDMDFRFGSGGFARAGGNIQSLTFAYAAMSRVLSESPIATMLDPLRNWTSIPEEGGREIIKGISADIYDLGCAEGDGTAVLSQFFPLSDITGIDISPTAIARAQIRWPHLKFEVGDILNPPFTGASLVYTSHTIEHMEHPADVITNLLSLCSILIVIVPPVSENNTGDAHIGAKPINTWLPSLPAPLHVEIYNTLRPDLETNNYLNEGNALLIWRGDI